MKISPLAILLNDKFRLDKKFYFISGNEKTLMEKMRSKIIGGIKLDKNIILFKLFCSQSAPNSSMFVSEFCKLKFKNKKWI